MKINIYFDTRMSLGHKGLREIAKDKYDRDFCVFINKSFSALKMSTPSNTVLHYKARSTRQPINIETIKYLPACVNGGELDYNRALEQAVKEQYAKWQKRR